MSKSTLVGLGLGLAILTVSTSAGLAAHRHHRMMNPYGYEYGGGMGGMAAMPGESSDYEQYMKNLRDSGYDPKKDYNAAGTMRVQ